MKLKTRLLPFIQNTPGLLLLNLISSLILLLINQLLHGLSEVLLGLSGRVTISSGDFTFLFTGWQGWLLIAVLFVPMFAAGIVIALAVYQALSKAKQTGEIMY